MDIPTLAMSLKGSGSRKPAKEGGRLPVVAGRAGWHFVASLTTTLALGNDVVPGKDEAGVNVTELVLPGHPFIGEIDNFVEA
jgi:hypothetical protein